MVNIRMSQRGFTLIELLSAIVLMSWIVIFSLQLFTYMYRSIEIHTKKSAMLYEDSLLIIKLASCLLQTEEITYPNPGEVAFRLSMHSSRVVCAFEYKPKLKKLTISIQGDVHDMDFSRNVSFSVQDRNGAHKVILRIDNEEAFFWHI